MRHWALALVTLCATAPNAAAQTADPFLAVLEQLSGLDAAALTVDPFVVTAELRGLNRNGPTATPDVVVARLMSFDRNKDGKLTVDELSERMQGLIARGDRGGDGALDAKEIRTLAVAPTPVQVDSISAIGGGGYRFGDEVGFSTRMHIEGALDDLRLATGPREQALAIATAFVDKHEKAAITELVTTLAPMLPADQLKAFTSLLEQMSRVNASTHVAPASRILLPLLSAQLTRFSLSAEQLQQAKAAIEKFKERQQLAESDRTQLMAELADTLSVEERENLNAALTRRPLVKNSLPARMAVEVIRGGTRSN
jgi:hypothetical protein